MRLFNKAAMAVMIMTSFQCCSHKIYPDGVYQSAAVTADGALTEWNRPLRFGSSTGLAQYNVTNDKDNLYISLETHDEATALKILRSGIDIYIDPTAGQHKKMMLAFPLPAGTVNEPVKKTNEPNASHDRQGMRRSLLLQAITFSTKGFTGIDDKLYDVTDKSKIKVAVAADNDNGLGYEAVIPIKYIFPDTEKMKGRNISVGIVINAMKNPNEQNRNAGNPAGARSSMGTGRRGGGTGGGRMGSGGGGGGNYRRSNTTDNTPAVDRTALYKSDANWYTFKLAEH